jgi:hypothetical protein
MERFMSLRSVSVVALVALGACGLVSACGDTIIIVRGRPDGSASPDVDSSTVTPDTDAETSGDGAPNPVVCPAGSETRISGIVYDPAGKTPLYNARVFIPSGPLPPIPTGVPAPDPGTNRCGTGRTCDSEVVNPIVATLSDSKGLFALTGPNVAPGRNVPLVIQVGKWRRSIVIPEVKACENTKLDRGDTRLPKNGSEGDMPQIALTTGCDALECLLLGIGIDAAEFEAGNTGPSKHVHMFKGAGTAPGVVNGKTMPLADTLWGEPSTMQPFDIAMLSCECDEYAPGGTGTPNKPTSMRTMQDYTNWGGRVFGTHYHYSWMKYNDGWKTGILDFSGSGTAATTLPINTSFPKGQALADWLVEVGASSTPGQITIESAILRESHRGAVVGSPAREWIGKGTTARHISFNTPTDVPANAQCGRFVFSDIHSTASAATLFPSSCSALSNAQLALEYMFFDLSSCVQDESKPPEPPK